MRTVFLRVLEAEDRETAPRDAIWAPKAVMGRQRFEVSSSSFAAVPRSPFPYWASERLLGLFTRSSLYEASGRTATVGLQSSDDFRFLRLYWELDLKAKWVGFAKGGQFSPYYDDVILIVSWDRDGREIKAFAEKTPGSTHWSRNIRSAEHDFRPGLTWARRTSRLSVRAMPAGCVFSDKGPAGFVEGNGPRDLAALAAMMNSRPFDYLVSLQLARTELAQTFEVGVIQRTPVPNLTSADWDELARLARRAWSLKRSLDTRNENSHAFTMPALLQVERDSLAERTVPAIKAALRDLLTAPAPTAGRSGGRRARAAR